MHSSLQTLKSVYMYLEATERGWTGRMAFAIYFSKDELGWQFSSQDRDNALVSIHLLSSHPLGRQ
jgi:hypothetical protein